jgi:hypothetical protein
MVPILHFRSHATGLFAFDKDIKIKKGERCGMKRNASNLNGELRI